MFDGNLKQIHLMECYGRCLICLTTLLNILPNNTFFMIAPNMLDKILDEILCVGDQTGQTFHLILPK